MFSLFEGAEARRLPGASQFPWKKWKKLGVGIAVFVLVVVIAISALNTTDLFSSKKNAPAVQPERQVSTTVIPSPQAQNVQENIAVAPVLPLLKWEKIGTASNGEQVMALPIPWDQLFRNQSQGDPAIWAYLRDVNRPVSFNGEQGMIIGYLLRENLVGVYGLASQDPHTANYWRAEAKLSEIKEIKGLLP